MGQRIRFGPAGGRSVLMAAATAGFIAQAWAGPPMPLEAQALAHWGHYARLSSNRQLVEAPLQLLDREQLRWWMFDAGGHWSDLPPPMPPLGRPAGDNVKPVALVRAAAPPGCGGD